MAAIWAAWCINKKLLENFPQIRRRSCVGIIWRQETFIHLDKFFFFSPFDELTRSLSLPAEKSGENFRRWEKMAKPQFTNFPIAALLPIHVSSFVCFSAVAQKREKEPRVCVGPQRGESLAHIQRWKPKCVNDIDAGPGPQSVRKF